jgi:periodic tryptophan protein 2
LIKKTFAPLVLYKKYGNLHTQDIIDISWTHDSRFFLTTSMDLTMKMLSLHKLPNFQPFTFAGNKKQVVKAFFSQSSERIFSVGENGAMLLWKWTDQRSEEAQRVLDFQGIKSQKRLKLGDKPNEYHPTEQDQDLFTDFEKRAQVGRYLLEKRTKFTLQQGSKIISVETNEEARLIVIGTSNGVFSLYNLDTLDSLHSF